jgi:hypothetical protein
MRGRRNTYNIFVQKYLEVAVFTSKNKDFKTDCMEMSCEDGAGIMSSA